MRKWLIGVLTATRAEFGLLKPLILNLQKQDFCETRVLVTGAHLSYDFGYTYKEIEDASIPICVRIECISGGDDPRDISINMALAINGFAKYFDENKLDLLIVLGDRYETMAVCIAAMNARIPIAHIHGGEITQGAIDESMRHAITKMSQIHFTSTEVYRRRVIQMGERPEKVYNVGALAVENIKNIDYLAKKELGKDLGIDLERNYFVVTFHPVTLSENDSVKQIKELFAALDEFGDNSIIITKANADAGGKHINNAIDAYVCHRKNVVAVTSLGVRKYLSAVKECSAVIGNSSSGITEAPMLHRPTVNIGDRQKGRIMPKSVICCEPMKSSIVTAINLAIDDKFNKKVESMENPFGDGKTSVTIVNILRDIYIKEGYVNPIKVFYDCDIEI